MPVPVRITRGGRARTRHGVFGKAVERMSPTDVDPLNVSARMASSTRARKDSISVSTEVIH